MDPTWGYKFGEFSDVSSSLTHKMTVQLLSACTLQKTLQTLSAFQL